MADPMSFRRLAMPDRALPAPRPLDFRLVLGVPLILMGLLLLVDPHDLDFAIAHLMYDPQGGFVGHHSAFLENVLHDRAKQAVILLGVLAIAGLLASLVMPRLRPLRLAFGYVVLAMGLSTAIVMPLKKLTQVQCPWSLTEFGGQQPFQPLIGARVPTDKPGLCWPGGHATAGFSLFALFFVLRDRRPRLARVALAVTLGLGTLFSVGRMLQGAHFLSHNLWTALLDWTVSASCYWLLLYRRGVRAASPALRAASD
jgi:membrane-associated PAP2 superfamily phosphatase